MYQMKTYKIIFIGKTVVVPPSYDEYFMEITKSIHTDSFTLSCFGGDKSSVSLATL